MFVLTSPSPLEGGEQNLPTPLPLVFFDFVLAFSIAPPYAILFLCVILCLLQ
jgi:hypothetical protein